MQNFVKIEEVSRNGDLRYIRMWLTRNRNKLPTFLRIKVMLSSNPENRHHCGVCFYCMRCNYECKMIEGSKSVKGFMEKEYGLVVGDYCLTPMIVKVVEK